MLLLAQICRLSQSVQIPLIKLESCMFLYFYVFEFLEWVLNAVLQKSLQLVKTERLVLSLNIFLQLYLGFNPI